MKRWIGKVLKENSSYDKRIVQDRNGIYVQIKY